MMKMKRIAAALIACLMALMVMPLSLADGEASTITMVPELTEDGAKLVLSFVLETNAKPLSGVVDLYYNAECLENPAPESDALPGQSASFVYNTEEAGNLLLAFASSTPMQSGEIFRVTFDLIEMTCTPGVELKFDVDIDNCELIDEDTTTVLDLVIEDVMFTIPVPYEVGDVNMNNSIDAGDATMILREVVGSNEPPLTEMQLKLADVNDNQGVDAGDATMVLRIVVGSK